MKARFLRVSLAALCAVGCSRSAPELDPALSQSLTGLGVVLGQPSQLLHDEPAGKLRARTVTPGPQAQVGARANLELGVRASEVRVAAIDSSASVTLRPLEGPREFALWGPAVVSGTSAIYPSSDGVAAVIEQVSPSGVKEDIVLTQPLGDALRFAWQLELSAGLTARLEEDGSLSLGDGRERFRVHSPVVKQASGAPVAANTARYSLEGDVLALEVRGLSALAYPVTIDPTVTVTTTAELGLQANLESGVELDGPNDRVRRARAQLGLGAWAATSSFTTRRSQHQAVAANGFLYVIGGWNGVAPLDDVQVATINANGSLGAFATSPKTLLSACRGHASVAYDGFLYVIGGQDTAGNNLVDVQFAPLGADGTLGDFATTTQLPVARTLAAAVAWRGNLYVIAGSEASVVDTVLVAPIHADGTLGAFASTTPVPSARQAVGATAVDGYLYVSGGTGSGGPRADVQVAPINPDGSLGAFTATTPLPEARLGHALVAIGGAMYAIGGASAANANTDVRTASIGANGMLGAFWPGPAFTGARTDEACAAWNDRVYLTGGNSPTTGLFNSAQWAQVNGNGTVRAPWLADVLPSARAQHAGVAYRGRLYAIGGLDGAGATNSISMATVTPSGLPLFGTDPVGTFPTPRSDHAAAVWNGYLYVAGGMTATNVELDTVHVAPLDPVTGWPGFFTQTTSFPVARRSHVLVAHNGYLYVIAGYAGATRRRDVQYAPILPNGDLGAFTAANNLNADRKDATAVVWKNRLYVLGGEPMGAGSAATVEVATINADGSLGPFTFTTSMNQARSQHASFVHNGFVYAIGMNGLMQNEVEVAPILSTGELGPFVFTTPFATARVDHTALVSNGFVYLMGGSVPVFGPTSSVEYASLNSLGNVALASVTTPLTSPRESHGSVAAGGYLYVAGGFNGATASSQVQFAPLNAATGAAGSWTTTSPLPTARGRAAVLSHNGFLYVVGGHDGTAPLSGVLVAPLNPDGSVGTFSTTTPLPAARDSLTAVVWKNVLYVLGGKQGALRSNVVWFAPINADGSLGAFTATSSFSGGREQHSSVAYDGFVYVIGGIDASATPFLDVQRAPVLADGSLGPFTLAASLPRMRRGHASVARDGFLYVVGGTDGTTLMRDVDVAPILANGALGSFWASTPLPTARRQHALAVGEGFLYVSGGANATVSLNEVLRLPLATPASRGHYSRLVTLAAPSTLVSLNPSGSAAPSGSVSVEYRTAPPSQVFAPAASLGPVVLGAPSPLTGSNVKSVWLRFSFDDSRSVVLDADAALERDLTDFTLTFNPDPTLSPASPTTYPRGAVTFSCTGGSGGGYTFAITTNASGGTIVNGAYVAGPVGGVIDVVTCTDSALARSSTSVTVTAGVLLSPVTPSVPPRGSRAFTAMYGSGAGFVFTLPTNNSGGSISPAGAYLAGPTGSVADTVLVTDSVGNTDSTQVNVTQGLALVPATITRPPRGTVTFTTTGGSDAGIVFSTVVNASGLSLNAGSGVYVAGATGNVSDVIGATDSLGNTASATVNVSAGVSLSPSTATLPPRGSRSFTPSGGSGTGFTWSLPTNGSGGSVDGGGGYVAGSTGNVTDVLQAIDSLGNSNTATITVGPGVSAFPATVTLPPRGAQAFAADGGSGTGFTWALQSSPSGGSISVGGAYLAGDAGSVTDVVRVSDSLGNLATATISISAGVSISPANASRAPRDTLTFTASGGSGTGYTWSFVTAGANGATLGATSGVYVAGTLEGTDDIKVTDSLGNSATARITVTTRLQVSPATVTLAPRATQQFSGSGGSDAGYAWTLLTNVSGAGFDAGAAWYQAGTTSGVDVVQLTDSLNNVATATITVGPGVSVTPATPSTTPRGSIAFGASGGSGTPFTWSLQSSPSGGTIGAGGAYVAGSVGGVTDVVRATDSLGNVGTTTISVGPAVTISPPALSVAPRESAPLSASGGSGAGFVWSFLTNASGGTLNAGTGAYRAGATGAVTDVVQVADSLGNLAQADLTVTAGVSIVPDAGVVPPRGTLQLQAVGGSESGFSWSLTTNRSGATLSPTSGLYQAGSIPDVVDELRVVDSLGNSAAGVVNVTSQLAITPAMPLVAPLEPLTFVAIGGGGGNQWRLTLNGSGGSVTQSSGAYVAGSIGNTTDTLQVTDVLGNVATTQITVTPALALLPATVSLAPKGTQLFTAQGGADGGLSFTVSGNASGATIDALTGAYQAGALGGVSDTIAVTDRLGARATARVDVGNGVSISPATANVNTGERQTFVATGGSGTGYQWALSTNASGGSIDAASGEYLAGPTGNVTDEVQVTDSFLNVATARVTVVTGSGRPSRPPAEWLPANGWSCGCQSTSGSSSTLLLLVLGALFSRRGRRARVAFTVAGLLMLVTPLAAEAAGKKKPTASKVKPPPPPPPPVVAPPPPQVEAPKEVPPPAPPPAPVVKGKPSVAVLDVEVTVPNEKLDGNAFSEMVLVAIDSAKAFKVISSKEIATMIGLERQKQLLGCSEDAGCMTEIANALGSDFVMVASVGRVGENYLVTTRLINGSTNKVTARASVQAKSANSLLEAVWKATQQVLDGYGASLPPAEAQAWTARPKPVPPATLIAAEETPSRFGICASAAFGYQPLSTPGNRGSIGAQVDLTFRRGRLDLAAGVVIARSPGARITATWALIDQRARWDLGLRATLFPAGGDNGVAIYGGGLTTGFEFALTDNFALNARVAAEAYPAQGTAIVALLGAAGVAARF